MDSTLVPLSLECVKNVLPAFNFFRAASGVDYVFAAYTGDYSVYQTCNSTSISELIVLIQNQLGITLKVKNRENRVGDVKRSPSNPDRLFSIFPNVTSVDIEEGLSATISWYENKLRSAR